MVYEFKRGSLKESGTVDIPLPLSKKNLKQLFSNLIEGNSVFNLHDFANWCDGSSITGFWYRNYRNCSSDLLWFRIRAAVQSFHLTNNVSRHYFTKFTL